MCNRSETMQNVIDSLAEEMFDMKQSDAIQSCTCVVCKYPATAFRDELSEREYKISGMCQKCQDEFFDE